MKKDQITSNPTIDETTVSTLPALTKPNNGTAPDTVSTSQLPHLGNTFKTPQQPLNTLKIRMPKATSISHQGPTLRSKGEADQDESSEIDDPILFLTKTLLKSGLEKIKQAKEMGYNISTATDILIEINTAIDNKDFYKALEFAGKYKEEAVKLLKN